MSVRDAERTVIRVLTCDDRLDRRPDVRMLWFTEVREIKLIFVRALRCEHEQITASLVELAVHEPRRVVGTLVDLHVRRLVRSQFVIVKRLMFKLLFELLPFRRLRKP